MLLQAERSRRAECELEYCWTQSGHTRPQTPRASLSRWQPHVKNYDNILCQKETKIVSHFKGSIPSDEVCWLVGCLTSQQHASASQGRICSDNFTCCHTEIEVADQTFPLTQSQYTDAGPTSPSADPITQAPRRVATGVPIFKSLI